MHRPEACGSSLPSAPARGAWALALVLLGGCSTGASQDGARAAARVQPADNSRCYTCHDTYQEDMLSQSHRKAAVGCADCHGRSVAHAEDKDKSVPPDVMFTPDFMVPFCATCHRTHDAPAVKVIAQYQKRCPGKVKPEEVTCTDCHGTHRLKARTVRWDRKTRALIPGEDKR